MLLVSPWLPNAAHAATTGEQKTAVVLVNFQDLPTQPITPAAAHAMVFGTVSDFYWENSYGKTFLSGDTLGWFTLPLSESLCDNNRFAQEADRMAAAAGINLAQYSRLIYLMPRKACMDGGANSGTALPSRMFATANEFNAQLITHELGHNFGLLHSGTTECGGAVLGPACTSNSYGDLADTMGSGYVNHFSAVHKDRMGWLDAARVATVSTTGTYTLTPFETGTAGLKVLKVPRGIDAATGQPGYYYIEYRQPTGFDATLASLGNLAQGVLVHLDGANSVLLDMTPNSDASSTYADTRDAALMAGRSWTDANGITLTLKSASAAGAVVEVKMGGTAPAPTCTRAAPSVSLSGPTTAMAAGSTAQYTISVANHDSAACAATTFNLARTLPTGWTGALSGSSLTLSPGATGTATLGVTSPASAAAGSYAVGVGTGSPAGSLHTASASATYSVAATGGALSQTLGTDKLNYLRGETVYMSARITSAGVALNAASVKFTVSLPAGSPVVIMAVSGSDGYARATYRLAKGKSAAGNYGLRADATGNGATATTSTAFAVK
ncbi:NEW3 domain-containing protein [Agrilutibacter solisilvae]|uniref:Alpha-galactosidase NEW3 domain-containing protein n=1 Tax=Agrilutibacter solisilvae TaxID=2763317 RepID=A0A974Y0E6_9GAMM|nr:NEW3 domain-containing protein [Lysobacter solisilvae]QSX78973.1 hypothetical protein I8J32_003345 [Lysobacter solisilvae]